MKQRSIQERQQEIFDLEQRLPALSIIDAPEFQSFWMEFVKATEKLMPTVDKSTFEPLTGENHAFINGQTTMYLWTVRAPEQIRNKLKDELEKLQNDLRRLLTDLQEKEEILREP